MDIHGRPALSLKGKGGEVEGGETVVVWGKNKSKEEEAKEEKEEEEETDQIKPGPHIHEGGQDSLFILSEVSGKSSRELQVYSRERHKALSKC